MIHVDWHLGRPGTGHLDGNLGYHWISGLLTGAALAWIGVRYWSPRPGPAVARVVALGAVLGQGVEPLAEVATSGWDWEPFTSLVRWEIFVTFMLATVAALFLLLVVHRRANPTSPD
jgi:hypothetical protein